MLPRASSNTRGQAGTQVRGSWTTACIVFTSVELVDCVFDGGHAGATLMAPLFVSIGRTPKFAVELYYNNSRIE